ncbi:unnamed protein product, partial [Chrysoparadoxa australica]
MEELPWVSRSELPSYAICTFALGTSVRTVQHYAVHCCNWSGPAFGSIMVLQGKSTGDDELKCAMCGSVQGSSHNLTQRGLLMNKCGHRFCESCCEREFASRKAFHCPICQDTVRKNKLTEKSLDEILVGKEISIRRKITKIYNKTEEDFPDLDAYNDYLEEVENIIYDLANGIDVAETTKKVSQYEQGNKSEILQNQARAMDNVRMVEQEIQAQQQQQESRKQYNELEERRRLQHLHQMRQEAAEVALGERDAVTATLTDQFVLGSELEQGQGMLPGMRQLLNISAPMPQVVANSRSKRQYENMPPYQRSKLQKEAGGAVTRAQ